MTRSDTFQIPLEDTGEAESRYRKTGNACQPLIECQDNLEFMEERLAGLQMKLIVTSPPYNLGKEYESRVGLDEYLDSQRKVIEKCVDILHPEGSICWQVGNYVNDCSDLVGRIGRKSPKGQRWTVLRLC